MTGMIYFKVLLSVSPVVAQRSGILVENSCQRPSVLPQHLYRAEFAGGNRVKIGHQVAATGREKLKDQRHAADKEVPCQIQAGRNQYNHTALY